MDFGYNGEIYNFNEIKKIIGYEWSWKTNSDTEVLLSMGIWKEKCLDKLVGMFAFSIYDAKLKKSFLLGIDLELNLYITLRGIK